MSAATPRLNAALEGRHAIERQKLNRQVLSLSAQVADQAEPELVLGPSRSLREIGDLVEKVSQLPATVLILGESGTGKELLARRIHQRSGHHDAPFIATSKVKWDVEYQKKRGITYRKADELPEGIEQKIIKICKRAYRVLNLTGYARMDLRLTAEGKIYLLEANPNPQLSYGDEFAESAETVGISYEELLQRILNLGLNYRAQWQV